MRKPDFSSNSNNCGYLLSIDQFDIKSKSNNNFMNNKIYIPFDNSTKPEPNNKISHKSKRKIIYQL